ncbi:hypothetical protein HHK36_030752 [Tetracentron sinense]|uniref:Uncharacterized protein n=1 Tax=Tetracentron sinense TaxID=13715 RepID=A0A834YBM8_TETSI|nr:hypothetical protein HHK36_030752 [Tetracentron sinense]
MVTFKFNWPLVCNRKVNQLVKQAYTDTLKNLSPLHVRLGVEDIKFNNFGARRFRGDDKLKEPDDKEPNGVPSGSLQIKKPPNSDGVIPRSSQIKKPPRILTVAKTEPTAIAITVQSKEEVTEATSHTRLPNPENNLD